MLCVMGGEGSSGEGRLVGMYVYDCVYSCIGMHCMLVTKSTYACMCVIAVRMLVVHTTCMVLYSYQSKYLPIYVQTYMNRYPLFF